jgi:hypothetical protein
VRKLDDKGTYLSSDNGHLNMKRQPYRNERGKNLLVGTQTSPGPGSYETNISLIGSLKNKTLNNFKGRNSNPKLGSTMPSGTLASSNNNSIGKTYNVPTIPSRYLTPILNFDQTEKYHEADGSIGVENVLISKV